MKSILARTAVALALAATAALSAGCATRAADPNQLAGPEVPVYSDGRLGGAWWQHPKGGKI